MQVLKVGLRLWHRLQRCKLGYFLIRIKSQDLSNWTLPEVWRLTVGKSSEFFEFRDIIELNCLAQVVDYGSMVSLDGCNLQWNQDSFTSLVHEHRRMLLANEAIPDVAPLSSSIDMTKFHRCQRCKLGYSYQIWRSFVLSFV